METMRKMLNDTMEYRAEVTFFKVFLDKVVSISDRFPFLTNLLSTPAILLTSRASCERSFSVVDMVKNKLRPSLQAGTLYDD
jgi:hypothetical protein